MPSPFPGMDPYIKSSGRWGDFHMSFLGALRGALNERLPSNFIASGDIHVWLLADQDKPGKTIKPDTYVAPTGEQILSAGASAAVAAPVRTRMRLRHRRGPRYLKIIDLEGQRVVTLLEVLSPWNKTGQGYRAYYEKRNECLASTVNFIEVDLLRDGKRLPLGQPRPASHYYAMVHRPAQGQHLDIWPWNVREALPTVPIPLTSEVPEILLPLRRCLDEAYDRGRYGQILKYSESLPPPWTEADNAWARELLAQRQGGA